MLKRAIKKQENETLSFLPSMVVISASLPMVKELVTVFPGVLEVMTKSFPFCLTSVIGLMSLAILITSAGRSAKKITCVFVNSCKSKYSLRVHVLKGNRYLYTLVCFSYPWPWGTPRSSPGRRPAMFHWSPCPLEYLDSPLPRWAGGCDSCVKLNTMWRMWL